MPRRAARRAPSAIQLSPPRRRRRHHVRTVSCADRRSATRGVYPHASCRPAHNYQRYTGQQFAAESRPFVVARRAQRQPGQPQGTEARPRAATRSYLRQGPCQGDHLTCQTRPQYATCASSRQTISNRSTIAVAQSATHSSTTPLRPRRRRISASPPMPVEKIQTLIIGGGQAGLTMSHRLKQRGLPHLVLERRRIAERWRSERWDGLHFQFPNWSVRLPDFPFAARRSRRLPDLRPISSPSSPPMPISSRRRSAAASR